MSSNLLAQEKIGYQDFLKVDIRIGKIITAQDFPEARIPAYKLVIDFGPSIGSKKSSAQITKLYEKTDLIGRKIAAVVNFPKKQIGKFMSEVLVLGFSDKDGNIVLAGIDKEVPLGSRLH